MIAPSLSVSIYGTNGMTSADTVSQLSLLHFGESEKSRICAITNTEAQKRSLAALLALRELTISAEPKINAIITRDADGRPRFDLPRTKCLPDFNISHSGSIAVAALAVGEKARVGVDTEMVRGHLDRDKIAHRFFTENEAAEYEESGKSTVNFLKIWTKKEACAKYTGKGLSAILKKECDTSTTYIRSFLLKYCGDEYIITLCTAREYENIRIINKCEASEIYELQT